MYATKSPRGSVRHQRGIATLMVVLVLLFILTLIVLSSTSVALFEQKTATNENRQRHVDQAAEYALGLGGEFLKANIVPIASLETDGWLLAGSTLHWVECSTALDGSGNAANLADGSPHPCMAEPVLARRAQMYFYQFNGSPAIDYTGLVPSAARISAVGADTGSGSAGFGVVTTVRALLCRIDTTLVPSGDYPCRVTPSNLSSNRIAVTLISRADISGENANSEMKETWANFSNFTAAAAAPLVASGSVNGTGNVEIVTAANGGGTGVPVSIWSASNVDITKQAVPPSGAASVSTCQRGEFLKDTPESGLKTTCVTTSNACGCPAANSGTSDFLSGHIPATTCCEGIDILDVDSGFGKNPDITFYPGAGMDVAGDPTDDSLFEWVFGISNESVSTKAGGTGQTLSNCGPASNQNCAIFSLLQPDLLNATSVTCAALNALGTAATGLYYVSDSPCDITGQIGSATASAIVVVNDDAKVNNTILYGMLFVRSTNKTSGRLRGAGNARIVGSAVVEGQTDVTGKFTVIYDDTSANRSGLNFPESTRLARVSGSWLDNNRGGY